eukprot:Awhi_evm1s2475
MSKKYFENDFSRGAVSQEADLTKIEEGVVEGQQLIDLFIENDPKTCLEGEFVYAGRAGIAFLYLKLFLTCRKKDVNVNEEKEGYSSN